MQVWEWTQRHTEGGRIWCSRKRPDQTRRTPINPRNRTAPQIKMHPGHSICVPLPSSQHDVFSALNTFFCLFLKRTTPSLSCQNQILEVPLVERKPLHNEMWFAPSLRGWREKGAPTLTYPDHREQSWASIYTCLPLGPQSNGSGGHFTQEKQIVEKNNINKKGKRPNPLPSFTTVVSQTFFIIIIMIIVYICSIKKACYFVNLFLKNKKKG